MQHRICDKRDNRQTSHGHPHNRASVVIGAISRSRSFSSSISAPKLAHRMPLPRRTRLDGIFAPPLKPEAVSVEPPCAFHRIRLQQKPDLLSQDTSNRGKCNRGSWGRPGTSCTPHRRRDCRAPPVSAAEIAFCNFLIARIGHRCNSRPWNTSRRWAARRRFGQAPHTSQ